VRRFGLIGHPLSHSFSPAYFAEKFKKENIADAVYSLFEIPDIRQFPELLNQHPDLKGLNVTIPYKESVIPYLDSLDSVAAEIGSVNTIRIDSGKTIGYNTDLKGIAETLKPHLEWYMTQALILGTGGSAKTVAYFLRKAGLDVLSVSRNPEKKQNEIGYGDLTAELIQKHKLIINCTPAGMYPDEDGLPDIPYSGISHMHVLFDLVYNPPFTRFMEEGEMRGATVISGKKMLQVQAEASWIIWNQKPALM
jgi:shikimate dehydrogenase